MPKIFDGFTGSGSWLEDFINSQAADDTKKESLAHWEDDVIQAVKTKRYSGLDEALTDLKSRVGLTETAMLDLQNGIMRRVAFDREWHTMHKTNTPELKKLAATKHELLALANEFDMRGEQKIADAIDKALLNLP